MRIHYTTERTEREEKFHMSMKKAEAYRNEIKSYIVRAGMTMTEVVDYLRTMSPVWKALQRGERSYVIQ